METYVITYSITITAQGMTKEQAEDNGWEQLGNLLTAIPSIKDFSCHNYGVVERKKNSDE